MTTKCKMLAAAVAMIMMGASLPSSHLCAREVYNMNARWRFFTLEEIDSGAAQVIYLPHTWNSDASATGGYWRGTANYLKDMEIPASWEGRRVFLRTLGAQTVTDLFVNSLHAGDHKGGSSAFTVEITRLLRPGETNTFRIVVSNAPRLDVMPTAGEANLYGGLFRGVELIVCEGLSISPAASWSGPENNANTHPTAMGTTDGAWITTTRVSDRAAEGTISLTLLDAASWPEGAMARVRFLDADEQVASQNTAPVTGPHLTIPFSLAVPHLWRGTVDPYLYDVEVTLTNPAGTITDSVMLRTGFRTVGIDEQNNFTLNGRPMRIRGVKLHRDRMSVGAALAPFQIEEDVRLIREMGANAVRVVGGAHSDYFYTLCDEAGLIVWNDGPFTGAAYPTEIDYVDTPALRANGLEQVGEMIAGLYNHPCVAMWGLFSEISMRGDDPVPFVRQLAELARTLDPGRLTAGSSVSDGQINFITDVVSFDRSFGWGSGLPDGIAPWIDQLARRWPSLHAGLTFSAGASILHQSDELRKTIPESNHHPEGWQTFFHEQYMRHAVGAPSLWGVFVGNMFDFGAARGVWGEGKGVNDHGLVTFDRKDRKDAFYLYKANWNTADGFVHIAGSRRGRASERRRTIRVYSNQPEVELFVGGRSQGRQTSKGGIFVWEGVNLRTGANALEARAGSFGDRASITISPSARP